MMSRVLPLLFTALVLSGCNKDSADLYLKQSAQSTLSGDLTKNNDGVKSSCRRSDRQTSDRADTTTKSVSRPRSRFNS